MKATIKIFIFMLASLVYGSSALAYESTEKAIKRQAPKGITNVFYECVKGSESDDVALAACQSAEKKRQDERLNVAYKSLTSKLHGSSKENLIRAERAWLELHSSSKLFESSLYGNDIVTSFEIMQNEIFRLCERANMLERYLLIANDK